MQNKNLWIKLVNYWDKCQCVHTYIPEHTRLLLLSVVSCAVSYTECTKILDSEKYVEGNTADERNYFKKGNTVWLKLKKIRQYISALDFSDR